MERDIRAATPKKNRPLKIALTRLFLVFLIAASQTPQIARAGSENAGDAAIEPQLVCNPDYVNCGPDNPATEDNPGGPNLTGLPN